MKEYTNMFYGRIIHILFDKYAVNGRGTKWKKGLFDKCG